MKTPAPFGYLLEQPAAPNGYVFITVEQFATIKDESRHLYRAVYAAALTPPVGTEGRGVLRAAAFQLSCHDQFDLAFKIAENVGYVLTPEPPPEQATLAQPPAPGGREVTTAMIEAAIQADAADQIQGFSYEKRHVIRDVSKPYDQQEIWSAPVVGPDEYQSFQRQCRIENMRAVLRAALSLTPHDRASEPVIWQVRKHQGGNTGYSDWAEIDEARYRQLLASRDYTIELRQITPAPNVVGDRAAVIEELAQDFEQSVHHVWDKDEIADRIRALDTKGA